MVATLPSAPVSVRNHPTFAQQLLRGRPKLMRRFQEDAGATITFRAKLTLASPAVVLVHLHFSDGKVTRLELPVIVAKDK